ncbi:MAG: LPXTG cell wall anchor domain-containing protein, partial [Clostridiales bacterium]|nr:LPXTG cell wall anchor domain-containing protein [Clostridiales bacterium]
YYSGDGTATDATGKALDPYTVPKDQYLTRFFFVAGDTASGNATVGNFLDDVGFTTAPLPSVDGEGNLQVKKVVYGLSEDAIESYSVTFTVYAEDGTTEVGTITLYYDNYVASESGTLSDGTPYYTLVDYISVTSADITNGTNYRVTENAVTVSGYIWNEENSTAVDYYYTTSVVTVLENSTTTITYSNYYEAGVELPSTGGSGLWMYTLAGLTLCGGAGVLYFRRRRQG